MGNVWATLSSIAADRDSGAAQIARAAAETMRHLERSEVPEALDILLTAHSAMGPLWRVASLVLGAPTPALGADEFLRLLESDDAATSTLAPLLPRSVLTISFSTSVIATVRRAPVEELLCMRSEPGGEGERTAEAARPTPARVIEDDEALELLPAEAVVVGADAVTPSGLVNKVKTRALAESARRRGVPCYAVAGAAKFVAVDLPVRSPFEAIPLELFDAIAAPEGLLSDAQAGELASRARLHPALHDRLGGSGGA
jgi:translation initiation factor 2B subunit (eIF-2B alpha/beta/delta family)